MPASPTNPPGSALQKDLELSLEIFRQKQAIAPNDPSAHNALGVMMGARGDFTKALEAFEHALRLCPTYGEAWANKGLVLEILGRHADALACFITAAELTPFYAEAESKALEISQRLGQPRPKFLWRQGWTARLKHFFRGLHAAANADEAALRTKSETELRVHLRTWPDDWAAALALGSRCKTQSRAVEAEHYFRYALRLDPENQATAVLLAKTLQDQEKLSDAIEVLSGFQDSLVVDDGLPALLLKLKAQVCDWRNYEKLFAAVTAVMQRNPAAMEPFVTFALWDDPALQFACLKANAAAKSRGIVPMKLMERPRQDHRLTIGYVSADFRQHAVATLLAQLFELHDRERFRIIGYSLWADDGSDIRRRIDAGVDKMVPLWGLSAQEAAQRIASDGVDIAVDLTGFMGQAKTEIFAYCPAPLQVNLVGMGGFHMNYVFADFIVVPEGHDQFYIEKVIRLPGTHQMNDRKRARPSPLSRAHYGLPHGVVVFCSFSTSNKFTPHLFDVWMRILARVPESVLWLRSWSEAVERNLRAEAAVRGINPDRLVFAGHCSYEEHLSRYGATDLALDTFGFGGHTTASDALWMACPIVTCIGNTFFGRVGASLLGAVEMPELITITAEDYENLIVTLATAPGVLKSLRRRLEQLRDGCRLFDSKRKTHEIEWAYERMWSIHAGGNSPESFNVPDLDQPS